MDILFFLFMGLNMLFNKKNAAICFFAVSFLYGLSIIALGSYYTWPNLESINESRSILVGGWSAWTQLMVSMDGRYATNLMHVINPMAWGWMEGYKLMPLVGVFFLFIGAYVFWGAVLNNPKQVLLFCSTWMVVHFAISPSLTYELYLMVFSMMYLWGVAGWLLWVGAFIRSLTAQNEGEKQTWFTVAAVFLVYSYGVNEMFLVANSVTLMAIWGLGWANHTQVRVWPLLAVGGIAVIFFFAGSGSLQRIGYDSAAHQFNHLSTEWSSYLAHYGSMVVQMLSGCWMAFPFLLLAASTLSVQELVINFIRKKYNRLFILAALGVIVIGCSLPFYIFMGSGGQFPVRIFAVVFSFSQVLLIGIVIIGGQLAKYRTQKWSLISAVGLTMAIFLGNSNYTALLAEWKSGVYTEFDTQFSSIHCSLEAAKKSTSGFKKTSVSPLPNMRLTIYDASNQWPGELNWTARVLEGYYKLDEVTITDSSYLPKRFFVQRTLNNHP
jgi:hypothetical protein